MANDVRDLSTRHLCRLYSRMLCITDQHSSYTCKTCEVDIDRIRFHLRFNEHDELAEAVLDTARTTLAKLRLITAGDSG